MSALATRTHTYRSTFGVRKQKKIVFLETSQAVAPHSKNTRQVTAATFAFTVLFLLLFRVSDTSALTHNNT